MPQPRRLTPGVLAERIKALDRIVTTNLVRTDQAIAAVDAASDRLDLRIGDLATKIEMQAFADSSRADRSQLHDDIGELRISQQGLISRKEADAAHDALRRQMDYLQSAVNRMLITLLSSLVLALVTALIWDRTH